MAGMPFTAQHTHLLRIRDTVQEGHADGSSTCPALNTCCWGGHVDLQLQQLQSPTVSRFKLFRPQEGPLLGPNTT